MKKGKNLVRKVSDAGKNSWKVLPVGILIDYKNKKDNKFYEAIEKNENLSETLRKSGKDKMKEWLYSAYSIAGTALIGAYLFAGLNGNAWKPSEAINYLGNFPNGFKEQIEKIDEFDEKYKDKNADYKKYLNKNQDFK